MYKLAAVLLLSLLLFGCSQNNMAIEEVSDILTSSVDEQNTGEKFIEISKNISVTTKRLLTDSLAAEVFGFGIGSTQPIKMAWVSKTQMIYCVYKGNDAQVENFYRVFLYDLTSDTCLLMKEINSDTPYSLNLYIKNSIASLLFSHPTSSLLLTIDLDTKKAELSEGHFPMNNSRNGISLIQEGTLIKIFESTDADKVISEFQVKENYDFLEWSPDGKYMAFSTGKVYNPTGEYIIYDIKGVEVNIFNVDALNGGFVWSGDGMGLAIKDFVDGQYQYEFLSFSDQNITSLTYDMEYDSPPLLITQWYSILVDENRSVLVYDHDSRKQIGTDITVPSECVYMEAVFNPDSNACILLFYSQLDNVGDQVLESEVESYCMEIG